MAKFVVKSTVNDSDIGYDMSFESFFLGDSQVTEQTSKKIIVDFGNNEDIYIGKNITYSGDLNTGGEVTGGVIKKITTKFQGKTVTAFTKLKSKVEAVRIYQEFVENDPQGTFAYILRGNDSIIGFKQDDTLIGYNGKDTLLGKGGDDDLFGEKGNDTLNGYGGKKNERDSLTGGKNKDIFVLGNKKKAFYNKDGSNGFAQIKDFVPKQDKIRVHGQKSDYELQDSFGKTDIFFKGDLIGSVENKVISFKGNFEFV